jgi:peptide/nickel transport system permease protein
MSEILSPEEPVAIRPRLVAGALRTQEGRVGLVLMVVVIAIAFLGRFVAPYSPGEFVGPPFTSSNSIFGTDNLGRDVWSRFLVGGQSLVVMAVISTIIGVGLGIVVGLVAGSSTTWRGEALVSVTDLVLIFPQLVLVLLFISLLGPELWLICILVGLVHIPRTTRVTRACTAGVYGREYVMAARAMGLSRRKILRHEVLPNISGPLLVELGLGLALSAAFLGALSFLGFGVQPPTADWGLMINENQIGLGLAPWGVLLPTSAIGLLTVGANLFADAIARSAGTSIMLGNRA